MPADRTGQNALWWDEPEQAVHDTLVGVFRVVQDEAGWQVEADRYHAGLYCASEREGVKGSSRRQYTYGPSTLPYNVCRAAVDTLQSKIATQRPLPQCLTQRGSWKSQKRARKMTQYLEGEFYRQRFFETHWRGILRDALIFGRGGVKVWTERDQVTTERVHPWEVFVDAWDARYGAPRNMYHCRSMDKGVALSTFLDGVKGPRRKAIKDAIESAGRFEFQDANNLDDTTVDRIDIIEAWHLPSAPDAKDGRHVIVCQGATLFDEEWEHDYFPFVFLHYNDPISGFWGTGLIEQLEGYQYEITKAAVKSSQQHHMSGVGILVPDGAGIHDQQIRNGITILRHKPGGQPSVFQMDLVNEHTRRRPRELTEDALSDAGISQMSAQSQKPSGITAAVALQTMDDIETQRFYVFARAAESMVVEVARRYVDCAKKIAEDHGELAVSVPMKGGLLELSWKDVYVDGVEIRVFPTSLLPQQLGARLERLKDLWNTGIIDRATFLRHLDSPDMQAEMDLETADRLVVDEMLERMLDAEEGEEEEAYMPPGAYQPLDWAAKRATQKLNRAQLDGAPEDVLDLLRRYIKDTETIMSDDAANAAPPMGPGADPGLAPPPPATPQAPEMAGLGIPGAAAPPVAA